MKNIFLSIFFLLGLAYGSQVRAAKVDLQPRNAYFLEEGSNSGPLGLYVCIQNNGPDKYFGTFTLDYMSKGSGEAHSALITCSIDAGSYEAFRIASTEEYFAVKVDSKNEVAEINENNNYLYFDLNLPDIQITKSWLGSISNYDTLYVLPGEKYYEQFSLVDLRYKPSIIGIKYNINASGFPIADENHLIEDEYRFTGGLPRADYDNPEELNGGKYSHRSDDELSYLVSPWHASFEWLANSSDAAKSYFWIGDYFGSTRYMPVGSEAQIDISVNVALTNYSTTYVSCGRIIKIVDRIRGDVNNDGIVDEMDMDIMVKVVSDGSYNPCLSRANMFTKDGINYGAGMIIFQSPDLLSNALLNIWLHDKNDPLVQGLGIGELMSENVLGNKSASIEPVSNTFTTSADELIIDSPDANLYNVTANLKSGKLFQATGKMGEKIMIPDNLSNLRVETVKVANENITTLSAKAVSISKISVYPNPFNDYINVKGLIDGDIIKVTNINGQTIYSSVQGIDVLRISSQDWRSGIYIVNVISKSQNSQSYKVVK